MKASLMRKRSRGLLPQSIISAVPLQRSKVLQAPPILALNRWSTHLLEIVGKHMRVGEKSPGHVCGIGSVGHSCIRNACRRLRLESCCKGDAEENRHHNPSDDADVCPPATTRSGRVNDSPEHGQEAVEPTSRYNLIAPGGGDERRQTPNHQNRCDEVGCEITLVDGDAETGLAVSGDVDQVAERNHDTNVDRHVEEGEELFLSILLHFCLVADLVGSEVADVRLDATGTEWDQRQRAK
mmetsp:Transcript_3254/g.9944  ORF Transcript_3254/g.9944 Transcript_3254/m.9944 type:complete len:239 (-) Transcript_3254:426-1142(-)